MIWIIFGFITNIIIILLIIIAIICKFMHKSTGGLNVQLSSGCSPRALILLFTRSYFISESASRSIYENVVCGELCLFPLSLGSLLEFWLNMILKIDNWGRVWFWLEIFLQNKANNVARASSRLLLFLSLLYIRTFKAIIEPFNVERLNS